MDVQKEWINILARLYKNIHLSKEVIHHSRVQDKKNQKILSYLNKLEEIHQKVSTRKDKGLEQLLKNFYYEKYIIKEEDIPESYYLKEQRILRERGYGDIDLTKQMKHHLAFQIIENQKSSLNNWIDYFLYDEESKSYDIWEKYWVFQGIKTFGHYDKKTGKFHIRDKSTVYPFPPVEREAVFTTLYLMEEYLKTKTSPKGLENALNNANFKTLYEYTLKEIQSREKKKQDTTKGIWIKYDQGSDYHKLRNSLQGYYTGWCTAYGENFAKTQLENGDFYVYYTKDENKEYKIPRIAIRMNGHHTIGEIRGISKNQNLEPEMLPILNKKLEEFPNRDEYYKKEHDMALLTKIEYKNNRKQPLTQEELKFLYELDCTIDGFGYEKDPRIAQIKNSRNQIRDLAVIFNVSENDISLTKEDTLSGKYKIHYGNLDLRDLTSVKSLVLPKVIYGNLDLDSLTSIEGLALPEVIHGNLYLSHLTSAEGLVLPKVIHGNLYLSNLTGAEGLVLPKVIYGNLDLYNLIIIEELFLSEVIHGNLFLNNLPDLEGLILPKVIHGNLYLSNLTGAEGLVLPKEFHGFLFLESLTSGIGVIFPYSLKDKICCQSPVYEEITFVPDDEYYKNMEKPKVKELSLRH